MRATGAPPEPPPSPTVIAAELRRYDGASTTSLFSSGIPLQPGALTKAQCDARQVRVLVSGVEVAASVTALRGRHTDGSLRSVLVQIEATCPSAGTVPVEIRLGETRTVADRAYQRPTDAIAHSGRYILPTSPTYLCDTLLTFQRLRPVSAVSNTEAAFFNARLEDRFDSLAASQIYGTARYDQYNAMFAQWCRSADPKFYRQAMLQVRGADLPYFTPSSEAAGPQVAVINPDGRTDGINPSDGIPNEPNTMAMFGFAAAYLLTGYRDYWIVVSHLVQWQHAAFRGSFFNTMYWNAESAREAMTNNGGVYQLLPGVMIDATLPITGGYGSGRAITFAQQIDWVLDVLNDTSFGWTGLLADYIGVRSSNAAPAQATFQASLIASWLCNVYLYVVADSRIPALVRKLAATAVRQAQQVTLPALGASLSPTPWGYSYLLADPLTNPSVDPDGAGLQSAVEAWTFPMWAKALAFTSKFYPAETINGATWATWYERSIQPTNTDPSHLTWQWKIFGEMYGAPGLDAPWIMAQTTLTGPTVMREPIAYATAPSNTPD